VIEQATITSVLGPVKTWRGRGVLLKGIADGRGEVEVTVWANDFPVGLVNPYLLGNPIDVVFPAVNNGHRGFALPFDNQSSEVTNKLVSSVVRATDQKGRQEMQDLPDIALKQNRASPHPMAETFERLLELPIEDEDSEI
jgi:hypothetical protein